jgi:hypothetical protein
LRKERLYRISLTDRKKLRGVLSPPPALSKSLSPMAVAIVGGGKMDNTVPWRVKFATVSNAINDSFILMKLLAIKSPHEMENCGAPEKMSFVNDESSCFGVLHPTLPQPLGLSKAQGAAVGVWKYGSKSTSEKKAKRRIPATSCTTHNRAQTADGGMIERVNDCLNNAPRSGEKLSKRGKTSIFDTINPEEKTKKKKEFNF